MGEGLQQITIPDFDDDYFNSSAIPFGRSAGHFGFNHSTGGSDSPTIALPNERDVFHSRGDSNASEDSSLSFNHTIPHTTSTRPNTPSSLAHSSQPSVTTPSPFAKKSSFASLRNAFKSAGGKSSSSTAVDAPPVPPLDRQAYPALRNPFSRSTSALAHSAQNSHSFAPAPSIRRPSVSAGPAASPPHAHPSIRPSTPGSSSTDYRHVRAPSNRARTQRAQHSHSGSLFHASDNGVEAPPIPRVPFGRNDTPPLSDTEEKIVMDPRTPSEFALHAVFISFAQAAEVKIVRFLKEPSDNDARIVTFLGPGQDEQFDALLQSLGRIATKNAKPVIDSIMRWRKSQQEGVSDDIIQEHLRRGAVSTQRHADLTKRLSERKDIATIYIMCRALIEVVQMLPKDGLKEPVGMSLEEMVFDQFRRPDLKLLATCSNHRHNADLFAKLLGKLANLRFESVTDRFLNELKPVRLGHIPKELDPKYEIIVKGLRHVQLKVWPPEAFEEGAEFMEMLSKSFEKAHGLRLKSAFAETLVHLLHPIRKTAQAEVNHPVWQKAIETIYPRAREMMSKPRYWQVAYPLVVTALCVAPHEFFMKNWVSCFEVGLVKLKEKPYRMIVMNGMMRLIWTYLYRCQESVPNTTTRLDGILKHFFPTARTSVYPSDESLSPFIYIVHFILSRHFEFGRELTLSLLQEQPIRQAVQMQGNITHLLSPERTHVALEAILMSLNAVEKELPHPTWPSNCDFATFPSNDDYETSSEFCPPSILSKPGMSEFFERCGSTISAITMTCSKNVGRMSIFDEQYSLSKVNNTYDDLSNFIVRTHHEGTVAYPVSLTGQINLLHTCFSSWPRCLHPSLPMNEAIDMLIRGIIHVEPVVGDAASGALLRIANDPQHLPFVMSRFSAFLFAPKHIASETNGTRLPFDSTRLLTKWFEIVESWGNLIVKSTGDGSTTTKVEESLNSQFLNIQAASLFLLSSERRSARQIAVKLVRMLQGIVRHFRRQPSSPLDEATENAFRLLETLTSVTAAQPYFNGLNEVLDSTKYTWLVQWRRSKMSSSLIQVAESDSQNDKPAWRTIYPQVIRASMHDNTNVLLLCREAWIAATLRYHSTIATIAGVKNNSQNPLNNRSPAVNAREREKLIDEYRLTIDQWHVWLKLVCCTASAHAEIRPTGQHVRSPSDLANDKEASMGSTRGLFKMLMPFLDSDHSVFRDAAVMCVSSFPAEAYKELLEDLGSFARHCYVDTARTQMSPISGRRSRRQDRLYLAVAHIYQLTAHHLKDQRGIARQDSLTNILKFVRHTQAFLSSSDVRKDWQQQQLRRYFCGIVERVFDGLASLQSSDRFIPANMHLTLYRLCEEWCQCGTQTEAIRQRLISMQTEATMGYIDPQQKALAIEKFQTETRMLSHAAVGAMASLCQKALFPPDLSAGSPSERVSADFLAPLDVASTLDRIIAMLATMQDCVKAGGRKALRSLVEYKHSDDLFISEVMRRSFVTAKEPDMSNTRFFEVVAGVLTNSDCPKFTFGHVVCLCLANLCSPLPETRRQALSALDVSHMRQGGKLPLSQFETGFSSSASNIYLGAQMQLSSMLAQAHSGDAVHVIVQCSSLLPQIYDTLPLYIFSHVLQSVAPWLATIEITGTDNSTLSKDGRVVLYHLLSLTLRFSDSLPMQMQSLWAGLVDERPSNGHATIRFLLEQSSKVGSTAFVACARKIVAYLSRTSFGRQTFDELCEVIEPARMLPTMDHKFGLPEAEETDLWSDLDALFAEQPRCALGAGQFALLFLADVAPSRAWDRKSQLPILLHGIFTHVGHRNPYVRDQARIMLFQVLRSWLPGYNDVVDGATASVQTLKAALVDLEREGDAVFWNEDEPNSVIAPKMEQLCSFVIQWLEPLHPTLADEWGSLSLVWGTSCSIRAIAFRSLQVFRSLLPRVTQADLAQLLGRLSNTVAAKESNIQSFAVELILTLGSVARSGNVDASLLPTMYWCALACLSTPVETEFLQLIELLNCLLDKLDFNDAYTEEVLLAHKPSGWGETCTHLQPLLLVGMRSIKTYAQTFKLLRRLATYRNSQLIESSKERVRDMYTLILPWCLLAMEDEKTDDVLIEFASRIGELAEEEDRPSIARIMMSFVKSRFRTKDDFTRAAASALREHYAPNQWTEVVTLLLSLVLNQERWLQVKAMQFLKILFQHRETRQPVDRLGSELLMPLLRLLQTDLAAQALEVLEEPMSISGGLPARQVLRMSMHVSVAPQRELDADTEVFGVPEPSGWCVPRHEKQREICRSNVMAVFDTCKMPSRPSQIDFEPEVERFIDPLEADLGDLVQNLHELSTYFQETQDGLDSSLSKSLANVPMPLPMPNHQLEARVAAILAKSTDPAVAIDLPQTPFVDVFSVGTTNGEVRDFDDSDDDTDSSEFDVDTFAFDNPANKDLQPQQRSNDLFNNYQYPRRF